MIQILYEKLFNDWKEKGITDTQMAKNIGLSVVNMSRKRKGHVQKDLLAHQFHTACHCMNVNPQDYIKEIEE